MYHFREVGDAISICVRIVPNRTVTPTDTGAVIGIYKAAPRRISTDGDTYTILNGELLPRVNTACSNNCPSFFAGNGCCAIKRDTAGESDQRIQYRAEAAENNELVKAEPTVDIGPHI